MNKTLILLAASACTVALGACTSSSGTRANAPDEFRVVKKAPLVVPPEYNLRPPTPGQAQPFEVDEARTSSASAFGTTIGADASASERALVAAAGANSVNPIIRELVDYEEARIIRKSPSVSDQVIAWQPTEGETVSDSATGDEPVEIERGSGGQRIKLPGT